MQSRNESVNTSTVRRRRAISGLLGAYGYQGELDPGLTEPDAITGVDANTLLYTLAVDECAKGAVIEEHQLVAVVHERAVTAGDACEAVWQGDVARVGCWFATDHQGVRL